MVLSFHLESFIHIISLNTSLVCSDNMERTVGEENFSSLQFMTSKNNPLPPKKNKNKNKTKADCTYSQCQWELTRRDMVRSYHRARPMRRLEHTQVVDYSCSPCLTEPLGLQEGDQKNAHTTPTGELSTPLTDQPTQEDPCQ